MKWIARLVLILVSFLLFSFNAHGAVIPCPLDTTSPALTQGFLPIHGGSFQGVTGYSDPSRWIYHSEQTHWACLTCIPGMIFNAIMGLLNPATVHDHMEWCSPDGATVTGRFTIPIRMRAFHDPGTYYFASGDLTENPVFDGIVNDVPWHSFPGNDMDVAVTTGRVTLNPFGGSTGPNIHAAAPNGFTNFTFTSTAHLPNGDNLSATGMFAVYTAVDKTVQSAEDLAAWQHNSGIDLSGNVPDNPDFIGAERSGAGITSVADGGSAPWGSQINEVKHLSAPLGFPVLAEFNSDWPYDYNGYMYGGQIGFNGQVDAPLGSTAACWLRADMDLHHGILGTLLHGLPAGCTGTGILHASELAGLPPLAGVPAGVHSLTFGWQAFTLQGIPITRYDPITGQPFPGVSAPEEVAGSLHQFFVKVGDVTLPPELCTDQTAANFGGLAPCIPKVIGPPPPPPPPPLPPTWQFFTPFFQRLNDNLRVCDSADSKCVVIGTALAP